MINSELIEDIYYTLQGVVVPEARVPWVTDLFQEGSPCDRAYAQMQDAYDRLRERLGMPEEDEDVEIIIDSLMDIQRILAFEMFRCGVEYAQRQDPLSLSSPIGRAKGAAPHKYWHSAQESLP